MNIKNYKIMQTLGFTREYKFIFVSLWFSYKFNINLGYTHFENGLY